MFSARQFHPHGELQGLNLCILLLLKIEFFAAFCYYFLIEEQLIYNIMLVPGILQNDLAIMYKCISSDSLPL